MIFIINLFHRLNSSMQKEMQKEFCRDKKVFSFLHIYCLCSNPSCVFPTDAVNG